MPDDELLKALTPERPFGRPRVPARVLWHCYIARYTLGLPSVSVLIRTLEDNPFIARACGIDSPSKIPSQPTFSRFFSKLASDPFNVMVKNVSRAMTREMFTTIPGFGKSVSMDSTDIKAWASKSRKPITDRDATWSVKSSVGNIKRFWLGYRAQVLCDTNTELPIAMTVTTANVPDVKGATRVLGQARYTYSKFHPDHVIADAGYSSDDLRSHIKRQYRAEPIIKASRAHKKALALETPRIKMMMNLRVASERLFSRLKVHRAFNMPTVQGMQKVTTHCFLSMIVLQSQALATRSRISVRKVA